MKSKLITILEKIGKYELEELKNWKDESGLEISTKYTHGGYEGAGEEYYLILEVTNGGETSFWKVPGYYMSHDGIYVEIQNIYQVVAKEKTITVWVDAKTGEE